MYSSDVSNEEGVCIYSGKRSVRRVLLNILNMSENNQILNLLQSKSSTKQEVFRTTLQFLRNLLKSKKKSTELSKVMNEKDKFVEIGFIKKEILNLILIFL